MNQVRALKIQSMILENKIASTIPIFDLLAYKHATEQYILLLKSMNVLQNLKYYREGKDDKTRFGLRRVYYYYYYYYY